MPLPAEVEFASASRRSGLDFEARTRPADVYGRTGMRHVMNSQRFYFYHT